jgi:membrane-associated protease RseP (regulator of RpoE activity)
LDPLRDDAGLLTPPAHVWAPRPKFQDRVWLHALLFVLTLASTTLVGASHYLAFRSNFAPPGATALSIDLLVRGFWYSGTLLAILGCHELGHYFACRYYDVDASLPFFMPAPMLVSGTLGAFIRIREPFPSKRILFDVGIAGPIAGFLVAVPALFMGLAMSNVAPLPAEFHGYNLGEPLVFQLAARLVRGTQPDGFSLNLHPMAFAAWFGLLVTALNLVPIGQLDGGHISYAVFGRRSTYVTFIMLAIAAAFAYQSTTWRVWMGLMVVMLVLFGPRHPPVFDEDVRLDRPRVVLALAALLMFALCFTPAPIEPLDLIRR